MKALKVLSFLFLAVVVLVVLGIGMNLISDLEFYEDFVNRHGAQQIGGTPIFDIKPYIKFSDSHPDALCSYADENQDYSLQVEIPEQFFEVLGEHYKTVEKILAHDPRPSYQNDPERVYTLDYSSLSVSCKVQGERLTVTNIEVL